MCVRCTLSLYRKALAYFWGNMSEYVSAYIPTQSPEED